MTRDPVRDLQEAITRHREAVRGSGRTGTTRPWDETQAERAVAEVAAAVAPLPLPAELEWFWRNVDPFAFDVLPYPQLTDPRFALDVWTDEQAEGLDHPRVLFPIAYESHGFLRIELGLDPGHPAPVWYFAYCDDEFVCEYPSMASLFRATADAVEASGIAPPDVDADRWQACSEVVDRANLVSFVDPYFTASPVADRRRVPFGDARRWPRRWYDAQGIVDSQVQVVGRTHTVEEFEAAAQTGPVQGRLHGTWRTRAASDRVVGVLTDETGAITLALPNSVRFVGPGRGAVEVEVEARRALDGRSDPLTALDEAQHYFGRDHLAALDAIYDPSLPVIVRMAPLA